MWENSWSISFMITSSNGNIVRVTGSLCGKFTGHRWIPLTKASDAELWCFLWSAPWINIWVNNREAGDLRCHHAHHDVIIMSHHFPSCVCGHVHPDSWHTATVQSVPEWHQQPAGLWEPLYNHPRMSRLWLAFRQPLLHYPQQSGPYHPRQPVQHVHPGTLWSASKWVACNESVW